MRTKLSIVALAFVVATTLLPGSAGAAVVDTPLSSANVELIGTIPETGAIGGHVREIETDAGLRRYFLMTSVRGVSAYDVTIPEAPVLAGHLPVPHWENEDVDFSDDLLIVSVDPQWAFAQSYGKPQVYGGLYLIDISALPLITFAYVNPQTGNRWTAPIMNYSGHTTTCVRDDCSYAIVNGSSRTTIVDLRTPSDPKVVGEFDAAVGGTHDAQVDETGIVWITGGGGIAGWDFTVPSAPRLVAGPHSAGGYHHNALRPRAAEFAARTSGHSDPEVRPGELVLVTEEAFWPYDQQACAGQGRFSTNWLRSTKPLGSADAGVSMQTLDHWETELDIAGKASTAVACSAHYFDERDGVVAIGWYEQGVRFLDVSNPRDIRQIGYYVNKTGVAWGASWVGAGTPELGGGEIVYTIDASRGIDILRFRRATDAPTVVAPVLPEWLAPPAIAFEPHPLWGAACRRLVG